MSRFYRSKFPKVGDIVMCQTAEVFPETAYLDLLEYGNMRGIIIASEASRRLLNSMNRLFSVGKKVVAMVHNVDVEKGYIDLSKKHLGEEEITACENRYHVGLAAHRMVHRVMEIHKVYGESAWSDWGWSLNYDVLQSMSKEPSHEGWKILPSEFHETMKKLLDARFQVRPVTVKAIMEVCCPSEGVDGLKALFAPFKVVLGSECRCRVVSSPRYVVTVETTDVESAKRSMAECIDEMSKKLADLPNGLFNLVEAPNAVSEEEFDVKKLLEGMTNEEKEENEEDEDEDGWE